MSVEVLAVVESPNLEGFGVLNAGATESVASLESLDHIVQKRCLSDRDSCGVKVVPGLFKTFRFGTAPRRCQEASFFYHWTGVPLLIGVRTLEKLVAVVDGARGAMVLKTVEGYLVVPLKRSDRAPPFRHGHPGLA